MVKRFLTVLLMKVLAIIVVLLAARYPTGPNAVSFEEPVSLILSIGVVIMLFLPPLIFSFFNHFAVKIISTIYQSLIILAFLGIVPLGFIVPKGFWISVIGVLGSIVSIYSIMITILVELKSNDKWRL